VLREVGATRVGQFVTKQSENTFPKLSDREGDEVFVWLASLAEEATSTA
jgi:hypothetical protein